MQEPRPPHLSSLWSLVWLVAIGTVVLWLAAQLLAQVWPWLLGFAVAAAVISGLAVWRRRRDRW